MNVSTIPDLLAAIRKATGRKICKATLYNYRDQGCPVVKGPDGYNVDAACDWIAKSKPVAHPSESPPEVAESHPDPGRRKRRKERNWHEEKAKQQALTYRQDRLKEKRRLVPDEVGSELLCRLVVEMFSRLEQLEVTIPRLVDKDACDHRELKSLIRDQLDTVRLEVADAVAEWLQTVSSGEKYELLAFSDEFLATAAVSATSAKKSSKRSSRGKGSRTESGSKKTGGSRKAARTPGTRSKGSTTGGASSKRSKKTKRKKSS